MEVSQLAQAALDVGDMDLHIVLETTTAEKVIVTSHFHCRSPQSCSCSDSFWFMMLKHVGAQKNTNVCRDEHKMHSIYKHSTRSA